MTTIVDQQIFRAYDIRGVVDQTLTNEAVYAIAKAIATKSLALNIKQVVIGRDGRLSGERLSAQLAAGLRDAGCDVIDVGAVPTPLLYFAAQHLQIPSAIMLTGSHNPPDYNGLKIIIAKQTIYDEQIQELYQLIANDNLVTAQQPGSYQQQDIIPTYIEYVTQNVKLQKKLKIVVDCGNGIAGKVAPQLYENLGCTVIPLYCEVDGMFPNHHPDPGDPNNLTDLIAAVKDQQADLGVAFDGDGDRLGVVDETGKIIWADRILMLFAEELLARKPQATIIYDVKCSRDVEQVINAAGGKPLMWKTGHSLIKAKMRETQAELAAEMSGHIFFKDRWFGFDDGLYSGARLLEDLTQRDLAASKIFAEYPEMVSTPEISIPVADNEKFAVIESLKSLGQFQQAEKIITIDGLRVEYQDGWGLIRPSNTTPKLVARFEAVDDVALGRIKSGFKEVLTAVNPDLDLVGLL